MRNQTYSLNQTPQFYYNNYVQQPAIFQNQQIQPQQPQIYMQNQIYQQMLENRENEEQFNVINSSQSRRQSDVVLGNPKNLGLFDFVLNTTPTKGVNQIVNSSMQKSRNSVERSREISYLESARGSTSSRSNISGINHYMNELKQLNDVPKYSPIQSKQVGNRLYQQYFQQQSKLQQLKGAYEKQILQQMKDKPNICAKSVDLVQKMSVRSSFESKSTSQSHKHCYCPLPQSAQKPKEEKKKEEFRVDEKGQYQIYQDENIQKYQEQKFKLLTPAPKIPKREIQNRRQSYSNPKVLMENRELTNIVIPQSQGEKKLKKLCQDLSIQSEQSKKENSIKLWNEVTNVSEFMKQGPVVIKPQQMEHKLIQQILDVPPSVSRTQAQLTSKSHQPKENFKKHISIINQIKTLPTSFENSNTNSYFNIPKQSVDNRICTMNQVQQPQVEFLNENQLQPNNVFNYCPIRNQKSPIKVITLKQPSVQQQLQQSQVRWDQIPLYDRNMLWKHAKDHDIQIKQQQKEKEEIKDCSFRPTIEPLDVGSSQPASSQRSSHSPTPLSLKPNLTYLQLSNQKKKVQQELDQQPQFKLRVIERCSSYCSSAQCSTNRNVRSGDVLNSENQIEKSKQIGSQQNQNMNANVQSHFQLLDSFLTEDKQSNIQSVVSQYFQQQNSQNWLSQSKEVLKSQPKLIPVGLNSISTKSLFDLSNEEIESNRPSVIIDLSKGGHFQNKFKRGKSISSLSSDPSISNESQKNRNLVQSYEPEFTLVNQDEKDQPLAQKISQKSSDILNSRQLDSFILGSLQGQTITSTSESWNNRVEEYKVNLQKAKDFYFNGYRDFE